MLDLSPSMKKQAKKLGCPEQQIVLADLMSIGYSESDAYSIAYPENAGLSAKQNDSIMRNILSTAKFKKVLDERRANIKSGAAIPIPVDEIELVGTEEVLKEILRSAKQQPTGSKERADLFAKYNDIKRESEQTVNNEQDSITFAFPIKCYQCPLLFQYNEYRKENGERELRPVEMERVIKLADSIIKKAKKKEEEGK